MRHYPSPQHSFFTPPHLCLARRSSWLRPLVSFPAHSHLLKEQRFRLRDGLGHRLYRPFWAWECLSSSVRALCARHPPPHLPSPLSHDPPVFAPPPPQPPSPHDR